MCVAENQRFTEELRRALCAFFQAFEALFWRFTSCRCTVSAIKVDVIDWFSASHWERIIGFISRCETFDDAVTLLCHCFEFITQMPVTALCGDSAVSHMLVLCVHVYSDIQHEHDHDLPVQSSAM